MTTCGAKVIYPYFSPAPEKSAYSVFRCIQEFLLERFTNLPFKKFLAPQKTVCTPFPRAGEKYGLRTSDTDPASGVVEILEKIIKQIRLKWKGVKTVFRGDGSFCRDAIMRWCEKNRFDYVIGLAKNERLVKEIEKKQKQAQEMFDQTGKPTRVFTGLLYKTLKSWSTRRYVVAKAEHLSKGANARFIVTSLVGSPQFLYEKQYCKRGDMENRIKEQQLDLFADRTSSKK